jgi:phosphatidate phosphatase APP1
MRKNVLEPVRLVSSQSLAANFTSAATIVDFLDNIAYQINITTTNSTGNFIIQASMDYVPSNNQVAANAGNWVDLDLSGDPTVAAANDSILVSLNQVPFRAVRVKYVSTIAGTGTCDIYIQAKAV